MAKRPEKEAKTVLMVRFSAFGDVAMTIPVVYAVCRANQCLRFVMLTRKAMAGMFVNAPANLTVEGVDLKNRYKGIAGIVRLARELRAKYRPAVFVDLHNVLRTKMLGIYFAMRGLRTAKLHKPRRARRRLVKSGYLHAQALPSQLELYRRAFERAGIKADGGTFRGVFDGAAAPEASFAAITGPKPAGERWVGIAPFAAHAQKVYPIDKMEKVLAGLQARADGGERLRVFLFGGGDSEAEILGKWEAKYPVATSLAGKKYGFAAELGLMNRLDTMLSMDSANMHLGAIAGTHVVSIWGATHPCAGFAPWNQPAGNAVQLPMDCRPCSVFGNKPCHKGHMACMAAIDPLNIIKRL